MRPGCARTVPPDFADFFRRRDDDAADLTAIDGTDRFILDGAPHVHGDALRQPSEVAVASETSVPFERRGSGVRVPSRRE